MISPNPASLMLAQESQPAPSREENQAYQAGRITGMVIVGVIVLLVLLVIVKLLRGRN